MRIADLYREEAPVLSLEIFPPNPGYPVDSVFSTLDGLAGLSPGFISVTFSPGRGVDRTEEIASRVRNEYGLESLAHLTCLSHRRERISEILERLSDRGVNNVLALRGDPPTDGGSPGQDFSHAYQLVREIRRMGGFCVGAAAYPEGHPESSGILSDLDRLKQKADSGADFLITQMFFDNRIYFDFLHRARETGIEIPVVPGVMPVLNLDQVKRIIYLCGVSIPARLLKIFDRFGGNGKDLGKAGADYAVEQIRDLLEKGARGVHIYTMNRVSPIARIVRECGLVSMESSA